jgi:hypothetical protein
MPSTNAERTTEQDLAQAEKESHEPPTKPMLSAQDEHDEESHANTNIPADPSAGPITAASEPLRTVDPAANTFVPIPLEPANTTDTNTETLLEDPSANDDTQTDPFPDDEPKCTSCHPNPDSPMYSPVSDLEEEAREYTAAEWYDWHHGSIEERDPCGAAWLRRLRGCTPEESYAGLAAYPSGAEHLEPDYVPPLGAAAQSFFSSTFAIVATRKKQDDNHAKAFGPEKAL